MKKNIFITILSSMLFFVFYSISFAAQYEQKHPFESKQKLNDVVMEHLKQKTDQKLKNRKILINPISARLNLPTCQVPINLQDKSPNKKHGRMTIRLTCAKPYWKLFVTATVQGDIPVVVAINGIIRQSVINKYDIEIVYKPFRSVRRGTMQDLDSVIGMRNKRAINPNAVIMINMLQHPYVVLKNQPIKIISYIGNLKVTSKGISLENGINQQQVSFRNIASEKVLKGIVIAPNTVLVP